VKRVRFLVVFAAPEWTVDLIVCILYCILFVFMLELLCFSVATEFSVNKDLYIKNRASARARSLYRAVSEYITLASVGGTAVGYPICRSASRGSPGWIAGNQQA